MKKILDISIASIIFGCKEFFCPITKFFRYMRTSLHKDEFANTVSQLNLQIFKLENNKDLYNRKELESLLSKLIEVRDYLKAYIEKNFPEYLENIKHYPIP